MKILFLSHAFSPAIGGIEASSELLVSYLVKAGHDVRLMTMTVGESPHLTYPIIRQPSVLEMLKQHAWADIVYENNPCLRLGWPKFLLGKPSVVTLQTWISRTDGRVAPIDRLKRRWLGRATTVVAISEAVRQRHWPAARVIGNSYNDALFSCQNGTRQPDFVFLGRLVSDKGADLAIRAFGDMAFYNPVPNAENLTLTIIGVGPDRPQLEALAASFPDPSRVKFLGPLQGEALVAELNRHRFLFIPSVWEEPFGIVALEGIACGLIPIASDGGGLPDAVGQAGVIFKRGQLDSLIQVTTNLLNSPEQQQQCRRAAPAHLAHFSAPAITQELMRVLEAAAQS